MSTVNRGSVYDANPPPYTIPDMITEVIGGSAPGNATLTKPSLGFASLELAQLFGQNRSSVASGALAVGRADNSHLGGIVGGVVAGFLVACILFIIALIWVLHKKS